MSCACRIFHLASAMSNKEGGVLLASASANDRQGISRPTSSSNHLVFHRLRGSGLFTIRQGVSRPAPGFPSLARARTRRSWLLFVPVPRIRGASPQHVSWSPRVPLAGTKFPITATVSPQVPRSLCCQHPTLCDHVALRVPLVDKSLSIIM
jgi:hypothetical protein